MKRFSMIFAVLASFAMVAGSAAAATSGSQATPQRADVAIPQVPTDVVDFFDDFDSYTAGTALVVQNGTDWDTWSNAPGGSEDPLVSDLYSNSGSNSVVIIQNNDAIRRHGDQTSGLWKVSFDIYIPSGKAGYFNTMSDFDVAFYWVMEVYFNADGTGDLLTGDPDVSFNWTADTWQTVELIVDLDADLGEFIFDNVSIGTFSWTMGTSGGTGPLQLAVTDFFGATASDEMYVDNYLVEDGLTSISCGDITQFLGPRCNSSGVVQAQLRMVAGDYTGKTITFLVDGSPVNAIIQSDGTRARALLNVPHAGIGQHSVELVDPAGCGYGVGLVNCQVDAPPDPEWERALAEYEDIRATVHGTQPTSMGVATARQFVMPPIDTEVLYDQTGAAVL
ncbi:MAG: hypothetical protein OEV30_11775, partial [Ignavibacteria bacterium]|nr:hypothetical protein [Ignavibacteria bacterium]